jgi:hypothetical protein
MLEILKEVLPTSRAGFFFVVALSGAAVVVMFIAIKGFFDWINRP